MDRRMARGHKTGARQKGNRTRLKLSWMGNWPRRPSGRSLVYHLQKSLPCHHWTSCITQCGLSCRAGSGDRRPQSPRRRLPASNQRWLRGVRMVATPKSRSRSSGGCRICEPGLPNCRRSRLVASIHLLFVYFAGHGADAMLNSCCRGRYTPCSSVRTRETRISSPSPANTMVGSPLHVSPKATVRS
jgi:hypothetical protein